MKHYISLSEQLEEKSVNQSFKDVKQLYIKYRNKFNNLTDLVDFISKELGLSDLIVLQILETL